MWEPLQRILETAAALMVIGGAVFPFIWRWFSRINVTYLFSKQMAMNHLPHIYHVQKQIAQSLGVDVPDDPPIHFVEINGEKK